MLPFKTLIIVEENSPVAIYRQIANKLIGLIQQGLLQPGVFFPGSRELAAILGVHRKTIIAAYQELAIQNWVETLPRKGIRVAADLPVIKPRSFKRAGQSLPYHEPARFSFLNDVTGIDANPELRRSDIVVNDGFPDTDLAPFDLLMREYRKQLQGVYLKRLMSMRDFGGTPALKDATSLFLNDSRGLNISNEHILITRGAQMAIYIAASLILKPGDKVLVSDPNYFIADAVFTKMGARLVRIPVGAEGMDVDAIENALKKTKIKLLYIIPHHHHPTTVTMSSSRRIKLLQLIKQYQLPVIEDDYDYDFHYRNSPVLPLASASHGGNVIYIGSFTKLLAPSFRLGYMIGPANFIAQAINLKRLIDLRGDTLMEEALANMITTGDLGRHIKKSNKIYSQRCDLICQLFNEHLNHAVTFSKPQGGMALWLKFHKEYPLATIIPKALSAGLVLLGSAYYKGENEKHNGLRFGFASLKEKDMQQVVDILSLITK
ncbi:PLP-dependent aminotransferase family protein [Mucilaginibacter sp. SP1R1]|uniref:MocR-like pyridoxine biosynthesis transcription factor PdxR n=1 Tax=Mucilaginibacter sp. SP1R1 TaxID=2723091 RepID=UPI00161C5871|nr:PLP-dependent aminotransferase family protein [Mucilaginibacter sp. SP1R1]MBB6147641.1 GntR family transcriptional regulator/MocR family aminotransferase [Mucilaginibacter sp. SP1R1]